MPSPRFRRIDRRRLVTATVVGGGAVLLGGLAGSHATVAAASLGQGGSAGVPMFRGNAARTGEMPGPAPSLDKPIVVKWRFAIGRSLQSSPVIADGTIFITGLQSQGGDTYPCNLFAVDAATGAERWRLPFEESVRLTSPAVDNGKVFVGGDYLYAIAADTGSELWRFETSRAVASSPAIADGTVFTKSSDGNLYAIDAASGLERWHHLLDGDGGDCAPAVSHDMVFIVDDEALHAIDAGSGEEQWRFDNGGLRSPSPAVADGAVFFGGGELFGNTYVHAIDASTGEERWRFPLEASLGTSAPAVAGGTVFIGSDDGTIHAIDSASGEESWRIDTATWDATSPVVVDGTVLTNWGAWLALDATTGTERWGFDFDDHEWIPGSSAVVDGVIYASALIPGSDVHTEYLYALGNFLPTLLVADVTLRGAPSDGAVERGSAKAGDEIDRVGPRDERTGRVWVEVTIGDLTGWIPLDAIDPATLPPEGDIEYVYMP